MATGETIGFVLGAGSLIALGWLATRAVAAVLEGERPALPPMTCFGDFPAVPNEMKGARMNSGGERPNDADALLTSHVRTHDDGVTIP